MSRDNVPTASTSPEVSNRLPDYLLEEESNFLRFCLLMQKVVPQAVRHRFDQEFPPDDLPSIIQRHQSTLLDLKSKRIITSSQWNRIFHTGAVPVSSTFDVTLMLCLFRHLTKISPQSRYYDTLPPPSDISLGADLARIKYYRNILVTYNIGLGQNIDNIDFPIVWESISQAVSRMAGEKFKQECSNLLTANLESSLGNKYREGFNKESEKRQESMESEQEELTAVNKDMQEEIKNGRRYAQDLKTLFSQETSNSYDGRVIVVGAYEAGKTSLVMNLIGSEIPTTRQSTDGIDVYYGNLLYDLKKKRLIRAKSGVHHFPEAVHQKISAYLELVPLVLEQIKKQQEQVGDNSLDRLSEKILSNACEVPQQRECIPVPILDFAGQVIYYVTHQTFITSHGIYVITFDGNKGLSSNLKGDLYCEALREVITILDNIRLWISSILTYCSNTNDDYPKICFVATHKDLIPLDEREQKKKLFLETLSQSFPEENIRRHLKLDKLFFVDCFDKKDTEIDELQAYLGTAMADNPQWGKKVPAQFLRLEIMLAALVEENQHIMSRRELEQINKDSGGKELTTKELDLFLDLQNMNGKLTYLNTAKLRDYVVINPTCLVEVLKSIVTAVPKVPELKNGDISKRTLKELWSEGAISRFQPYHGYLRELLVQFDILAEQKRYDKDTGMEEEVDRYLVPCMVTKKRPLEELQTTLGTNKCCSFAFVFKGYSCPTAIPNRLIASALSMWNVKLHCGNEMLFSGFVLLNIDRNHDLAIQTEQNKIIVHLIHKTHKELIIKDLASSVLECLQENLNEISKVYSLSYEEEMLITHVSPFKISLQSSCGRCWISLENKDEDLKCDHDQSFSYEDKKIWKTDRTIPHCELFCSGLPERLHELLLTDVHLLRLCNTLTPYKVKELSLNLQLSNAKLEELDNDYKHTNIVKFYSLRCCRERNKNCRDFMIAMQAADINIHTMCKILREEEIETDLPDSLLRKVPSDEMINRLCLRIGREWQVLGLELGLEIERLEQIEYDSPRILREVSYQMLKLWRNKEENPTIRDLVFALGRIGRNPNLIRQVLESCDSFPNIKPSK